jgi:hypothetical protein
MSLYIKQENQELLWRTIHKTPLVDNYFYRLVPGSRERWFQEIVRSFHIKNPAITNQDALVRINRDTIAYMVSHLKTSSYVTVPLSQITNSINQEVMPIIEPTTIYSRGSTTNTRDEFAEKFSNRQKEYETMLQKPSTPDIQFSEKMEDEVIQNMDELINRHLKQRELDNANFSPLPPVGVGLPSALIQPPPGYRKITIGEELQNDDIDSILIAAKPPPTQETVISNSSSMTLSGSVLPLNALSVPNVHSKKVSFVSQDKKLVDGNLNPIINIRDIESIMNRFQEMDTRIRLLETIIFSHKNKTPQDIEEKNTT